MKFRSYANLMPCLLILALAALSSLAHAGEKVEFLKTDSTLHITIDGQPFATYNFSHEQMKPFLLPIQTQSGVMVNRSLNDASDADHPHHKGVWNSVDEINGIKFWREDGPIRNITVRVIQAGGPLGIFEVINQWQHPETGEPQLTETAIVTIHANRLLVYDMLFTASHVAADFEDTKEGMFGIRVAPSMKEKNVMSWRATVLRRLRTAGASHSRGLITPELSMVKRSVSPLWIIRTTSVRLDTMSVTTDCSPSVRSATMPTRTASKRPHLCIWLKMSRSAYGMGCTSTMEIRKKATSQPLGISL